MNEATSEAMSEAMREAKIVQEAVTILLETTEKTTSYVRKRRSCTSFARTPPQHIASLLNTLSPSSGQNNLHSISC